jgi:predicted metal-dependent enzyme (double-stranded beta helix superfamily)
MFDVEEFVHDCTAAAREAQPTLAVKEILQRAMNDPDLVTAALPPERAEIAPLHVSDELTVLKVVWAPGMSFRPHNHLMWAGIGLYVGQEDNVFYRRSEGGLAVSGGRELRTGDVALLGDGTIHSVENPLRSFTGAIHVYGGHLPARPGRSEWTEQTFEEIAYDFDRTVRHFEEANRNSPSTGAG